ncbi:RICIN domain-containing protein [Nonomuraea polychroma]|uniref:RICIN domain-containing protein n=1 Tax=Nonomuraea polychroma TaxID=46176 RepID=UPI003D8EF1D9
MFLAVRPAAPKLAAIPPRRTMGFRAIVQTAAVAAAAITVAVATPAAAQQQSVADRFPEIKHSQSGMCLDASVSQGVKLKTCNGSVYQKWFRESTNNGITIVHSQSRLCLDGSTNYGVRLHACNGKLYQRWYWYDSGSMPNLKSGHCIDGSVSQGVRFKTCNGTSYQKWS